MSSRSLALAILAVGLCAFGAASADEAFDRLLSEVQITPLLDQSPPPFTLEALDGPPITLAELRGRAVMLYFWEST